MGAPRHVGGQPLPIAPAEMSPAQEHKAGHHWEARDPRCEACRDDEQRELAFHRWIASGMPSEDVRGDDETTLHKDRASLDWDRSRGRGE